MIYDVILIDIGHTPSNHGNHRSPAMLLVSIWRAQPPRQDTKAEPVDPHCPNRLPYIGGSTHVNTTISEPTYHMAGGISYYISYDVPMFQWFSKFSDMSG